MSENVLGEVNVAACRPDFVRNHIWFSIWDKQNIQILISLKSEIKTFLRGYTLAQFPLKNGYFCCIIAWSLLW